MSIKPYNKRSRLSFRLSNVKVRLITPDENKTWNSLMEKYHYLENGNMVGPQLRYVAEIGNRAVALIGFSNASYHMESRDRWIGWNDIQRERRLGFVVQNSRFLVLPDCRVPNMASKVLSLCIRRISSDWEVNFQHPVLIAETFTEVDGARRGTGYQAAGWTRLGETKGFQKDKNNFYVKTAVCKGVWGKELCSEARTILTSEKLPDEYVPFEKELSHDFARKKLGVKKLGSLFEVLCSFNETPRKRGQRYLVSSCLATVFCGVFAGCKGLRECAEFVSSFSQAQLAVLRMWRSPVSKQRQPPSYVTLWRTLAKINPVEFENKVLTWFNNDMKDELKIINIDGKSLRATIGEAQTGLHVVSAVSTGQKNFISNDGK